MGSMLVLHVGGGWDELAIAVVAFAVLWVAVKVTGRKSAASDEEDQGDGEAGEHADASASEAPPLTRR